MSLCGDNNTQRNSLSLGTSPSQPQRCLDLWMHACCKTYPSSAFKEPFCRIRVFSAHYPQIIPVTDKSPKHTVSNCRNCRNTKERYGENKRVRYLSFYLDHISRLLFKVNYQGGFLPSVLAALRAKRVCTETGVADGELTAVRLHKQPKRIIWALKESKQCTAAPRPPGHPWSNITSTKSFGHILWLQHLIKLRSSHSSCVQSLWELWYLEA